MRSCRGRHTSDIYAFEFPQHMSDFLNQERNVLLFSTSDFPKDWIVNAP